MRNLAFDLRGKENSIGKFSGLENFFVHAGIAASVTGFAAGCEDDDFAGGFTGLRMKMNRAGFEIEGAMDGVQTVLRRALRLLRQIKIANEILFDCSL